MDLFNKMRWNILKLFNYLAFASMYNFWQASLFRLIGSANLIDLLTMYNDVKIVLYHNTVIRYIRLG